MNDETLDIDIEPELFEELEDIEDYTFAIDTLGKMESGEERTYSLQEIMSELFNI